MTSALILLVAVGLVSTRLPDAKTLLYGAYNARSSVLSGQQTWLVVFNGYDKNGKEVGGRSIQIELQFDGTNSRFVERDVVGGKVKENEPRYTIRSNDQLLVNHPAVSSGGLIGANTRNYGYICSDPRSFGMSPYMSGNVSLRVALFLDREMIRRVVGSDHIRGIQCYHVVAEKPGEYRTEYWIEPTKTFRVLKVKLFIEDHLSKSVESIYPEGQGKPDLLPKKVTLKEFHPDGWVTTVAVFQCVKSEVPSKIPHDVFTLAGLNLVPGETVFDETARKRVGYWDGASIAPTRIAALRAAQPAKPPSRSHWFWYVVGNGLLVAGIVIMMCLRQFRGKNRMHEHPH